MKFLNYLLAFLVVIIVLFLGSGLLTPSISYESEVVIEKPVEESWAVLTDETKMHKWIDGFKKIEQKSGTPNTVGAISLIYVEEDGEEMIIEETITNIQSNEVVTMLFTSDYMTMDYEMLLREDNGKTIITTKSTTRGNDILAKSILSFMTNTMKAQEDKNLNSLKKAIEENEEN